MKLTVENIVKLLQVKGVGRMKVLKLAELVDFTPSTDMELAEVLLENLSQLKVPVISISQILASFQKGEELLEKSQSLGIRTISYYDNEYPYLLKETTTPPLLLNILGNFACIASSPTVAVIGTRNPSSYGKLIGERIGYVLGSSGITVVSGLATGCDTAGHIGCLKSGGKTVAILAHGLDMVYPKENKNLAEKIVETGGCIVSEYMVRTRALGNYFIERDRIQAGLSKATIVVETDIKGGTMHTVNYTIEYKRILATFNHPLEKQNEKSRGNEMLIAEKKAIGIQTKEDIDALIQKISPSIQQLISFTKIPIAEVQLLFNEAEFEQLLNPAKEKIKKSRKKKSKPNLTQPQIFKDESDLRPGSDIDK